MIERVIIKNYKCIKYADITFDESKNIIVGNNGVGKSTLIEALTLALGYGLNKFEITPHIFNLECIQDYKENKVLPEILIEVYFSGELGVLSGNNNSIHKVKNGLYFKVSFDNVYDELYAIEKEKNPQLHLPCEYYKKERMWFSQQPVLKYKMPFLVQVVDTSSMYFSSSSNQYINQLIERYLGDEDTTTIKTSLRHLKENFDEAKEIREVNKKITEQRKGLSLSIDVTSRIDKRDIMCPFIDEIPVSQMGAGDICHLKAILALGKTEQKKKVVIIEEPESHLSHTKMYEMIRDIQTKIDDTCQVFITTHNSFVANKLDLSKLILLENSQNKMNAFKLEEDDYVNAFFGKVCHYPTLRMILAHAVILVEGPADEMVTTYSYYKDYNGRHPFDDGIELIVVNGTAFKAYVHLMKNFKTKVAIVTDNDGLDEIALKKKRGIENLPNNIRLFCDFDIVKNRTLEPSFVHANRENLQDFSDYVRIRKKNADTEEELIDYMLSNKTDWSYKLLTQIESINFKVPSYIKEAIKWVKSDGKE